MKKEYLPYICPEHPEAEIRMEWTRSKMNIHLTGASCQFDSKPCYYCNECGLELAEEDRDIESVTIQGTLTEEVIKRESIRLVDYSEEIKEMKKTNKHLRLL